MKTINIIFKEELKRISKLKESNKRFVKDLLYDGEVIGIGNVQDLLKQNAIEDIKNCKNLIYKESPCNYYIIKDKCLACQRDIERFGIKWEELK